MPADAQHATPRGASAVGLPVLFLLCTAIWGSTWLVIKFQLGVVSPGISVTYRFTLAAGLLAAWCMASGRGLAFPARTHAWMAAQGLAFFGLNYIAVYEAERHVASGLVAVVFSTIVFMTPLGARLAFGTPIAQRTMVGGALGVSGVALMMLPELAPGFGHGALAAGVAWALAATAIAAIGNLVSMRMHRDGVPVLPSAAWGMAYGAVVAGVWATVQGDAWNFDARPPYVASLAYLAVFGSVVAFASYLTLLKRVGPGPSSFIGIATPVIAMLLSTALEGYRWTGPAAAGVALAVAGNVIALRK